MNYEERKRCCHVRSGIYRSGLEGWPKVYWKNHPIPLDKRVPDDQKKFDDWEEYDPRERPECSAYDEMPA